MARPRHRPDQARRLHRPRLQRLAEGAGIRLPRRAGAFGLQFGHGIGCAIHERPIISRVVSLEHPTEIKEGMVFALETYCPATDGYSAARIEEEVVVTDKGCRVITLFPAEELPIANRYEFNNDYLPDFEKAGMIPSGMNPDSGLVEIMEFKHHPWFVGVQFHPEYRSSVLNPHPLFVNFIKAALVYRESNKDKKS